MSASEAVIEYAGHSRCGSVDTADFREPRSTRLEATWRGGASASYAAHAAVVL